MRLLSDERGEFVVKSMIGALVSMLVLSIVTTGIVGVVSFQRELMLNSSVTNQAAVTDSALRTDTTWASEINVKDSKHFTMTVPGIDDRCRVSTWEIVPQGVTAEVVNSVTEYEHFDTGTNPIQCSGAAAPASRTILVTAASPTTEFTYQNLGGRELVFKENKLEVSLPGSPRDGVLEAVWASVAPATVVLDTEIAAGSTVATPYRFAAAAASLSSVEVAGQAESHFVPTGSLAGAQP